MMPLIQTVYTLGAVIMFAYTLTRVGAMIEAGELRGSTLTLAAVLVLFAVCWPIIIAAFVSLKVAAWSVIAIGSVVDAVGDIMRGGR